MTRALVCGGRHYRGPAQVHTALDRIHAKRAIAVLMEGGATGVDRYAFEWACANQPITCERWAADWRKYGRAAGPIRNQQMLDEGKPDVVIAFPGGAGTADMVRRARAAGVEVIEAKPNGSAQPNGNDAPSAEDTMR